MVIFLFAPCYCWTTFVNFINIILNWITAIKLGQFMENILNIFNKRSDLHFKLKETNLLSRVQLWTKEKNTHVIYNTFFLLWRLRFCCAQREVSRIYAPHIIFFKWIMRAFFFKGQPHQVNCCAPPPRNNQRNLHFFSSRSTRQNIRCRNKSRACVHFLLSLNQ